eukprot:515473_1
MGHVHKPFKSRGFIEHGNQKHDHQVTTRIGEGGKFVLQRTHFVRRGQKYWGSRTKREIEIGGIAGKWGRSCLLMAGRWQLVDLLHGGVAGGGGGGGGDGHGGGVLLTDVEAKLDHAVDALGVGGGVLELEAGGEQGGVEEQEDKVLDGLVGLVGVDLVLELLDDGVLGVDLHGLLGHHVRGHGGVAERLVLHDLLHVRGPAELGGDEDAGGGAEALGEHDLLDLLAEDLLHLLGELLVGGLLLLLLLLLLLGLVELDALLGEADELEVLEVLDLLHDVLVDGVNHEDDLDVAALGLLEEGRLLELLLGVTSDVVDDVLVLLHARDVVLERGGLLERLGRVAA